MAGNFPFAGTRGVRYGLAPRMTIAAFFEDHRMNDTLQERYYRWWYERAKHFVEQNADLQAFFGSTLESYPYGQHAAHGFHLNGKAWAAALSDLGDLIRDTILPRLDQSTLHQLESDHEELLAELADAAKATPPPGAPDVGYFRHV
jgi:hypothetical protein